MLKISYADCLGLSPTILSQFTVEMCAELVSYTTPHSLITCFPLTSPSCAVFIRPVIQIPDWRKSIIEE